MGQMSVMAVVAWAVNGILTACAETMGASPVEWSIGNLVTLPSLLILEGFEVHFCCLSPIVDTLSPQFLPTVSMYCKLHASFPQYQLELFLV